MEKLTIHQAFAKAQSEMPVVKKEDKNPFFKSKYAGLPSVLEAVLPILHNNNFYVTQIPFSDGERIGVETIFTYTETGESITGKLSVNLSKNDPQGAGSAITYTRRYMIVSMLGLNVDIDDDANLASPKALSNATDKNLDIINDDSELM